jgi:nucleoside-diphosphate-sugar epimerase
MKNILVIGSTGQIGSELTMELRRRYAGERVVAGYIRGSEPQGELAGTGPATPVDITDGRQIAAAVSRYRIDTVYNLAALLSAVAEERPRQAWTIGVAGLFNVLEVAREMKCAVFTPSSIGAFGPDAPKRRTPQDASRNPLTLYGVTKVTGELLSDYYFQRYRVDTRSVRFPGLISHVAPPGGGTTDYAVDIFYAAVRNERFLCPLAAGTFMDMMYMPDGVKAAIRLMEADPSRLKHRNAFNVTAMSLDPEILYRRIKRDVPHFEMEYRVDPLRQAIADSWPDSLDDACAREEWDWLPEYDLDRMTEDMLGKLRMKLNKSHDNAGTSAGI